MAEPQVPPQIHRAYHSFCHADHLRDDFPAKTGGGGHFTDLPSHLKHTLGSFPGIRALLVMTSLSFPAPADGMVMAGPKEIFEMPSTKSEALMKRRGLSMTSDVSSCWLKETNRSRIIVVGRHDAMLLLSSGTTIRELAADTVQMDGCDNDLENSGYPRTAERLGARVCLNRCRSAQSYRSRHRLPFEEIRSYGVAN